VRFWAPATPVTLISALTLVALRFDPSGTLSTKSTFPEWQRLPLPSHEPQQARTLTSAPSACASTVHPRPPATVASANTSSRALPCTVIDPSTLVTETFALGPVLNSQLCAVAASASIRIALCMSSPSGMRFPEYGASGAPFHQLLRATVQSERRFVSISADRRFRHSTTARPTSRT